jgi:hypothetical protein
VAASGTLASISDVEFTPLGGTTRAQQTVIWLTCGSSAERRFISIEVNPATGLAEIGPLTKTLPANVAALAAQAVAEKP